MENEEGRSGTRTYIVLDGDEEHCHHAVVESQNWYFQHCQRAHAALAWTWGGRVSHYIYKDMAGMISLLLC